MKKKHQNKDPYLARETARYENPIPSREYLLDLLRESIGPLTHKEICRELGLRAEEAIEALRRRLLAMERDGQVVKNRRNAYGTLDKMNLIKGRVVGNPQGFGFVIPFEGGEDLFLSSRQMRRVMDGDEVLVRSTGFDRRGRQEGSIVEVLERRTKTLVGRYFVESGVHFVRPENPRIVQDIVIPPGQGDAAVSGQIVVVEITTQPDRNTLPVGRVVDVLGEHLAPGMEIDIAIHNYGIPDQWSGDVDEELAAIPDQPDEPEKLKRIDLRELPFVTIDGEDSRDFDDAVYCQKRGRSGWKLFVAIADVSHYVAVNSALDNEAWLRGNSVYFPQHVVPMLPEKLSNNLCSLNPGVDRLCMVCEMDIDKQGEVVSFRFYEGVMHSHARLTYTQVAAMLAQRGDKQSGVRKQFHAISKQIDDLDDVFRQLLVRREARGAIDFDTIETRMLFDTERKIEQIIPAERTDAHRLIEECMLCANVCAATFLEQSQLPGLYRVHESPPDTKLVSLREFLGELGLGLSGGDEPTPKDFHKLLQQVQGRVDQDVIQTVVLRTMSRAEYRPENDGHFGLHYPAYTHFTSPIRRYPDLLVHRAIRRVIRSKKRTRFVRRAEGASLLPPESIYPYDAAWMLSAGEHCSMTERRADDATRDVESWLKCEYLQQHLGDEFDGVVSGVTGFGLFVQLEGIYIEGLVHITGLPKDYYFHEPDHHRLVGERTRRVFGLGDKLRVRVTRVDLDERKIDLDLVLPADKRRRKPSIEGELPVSPKARQMASEYEQDQAARKRHGKKRKVQQSSQQKRKKITGAKKSGTNSAGRKKKTEAKAEKTGRKGKSNISARKKRAKR